MIQMGPVTKPVWILCVATPAFWSLIFHSNFLTNIHTIFVYTNNKNFFSFLKIYI